MLDRKFILENIEAVKQNCINRNAGAVVDNFVALEQERKSFQQNLEKLQAESSAISKSIGQAKSDNEREAKKEEGRILKEKIAALKTQIDALDTKLECIQRSIPNMSHPDAPIGTNETFNKCLSLGKTPIPTFDFTPIDHVMLGETLDLIDFETGAL